jgi:hypothetical protein
MKLNPVCLKNCGEGFYMYLYTRTPQISEKKGKNLLFDRIRHLVCLGNERRDSPPVIYDDRCTDIDSVRYLLKIIVFQAYPGSNLTLLCPPQTA